LHFLYSLLLSVERHCLHTKDSFIHLVHKATYEYDEHSSIFWKKKKDCTTCLTVSGLNLVVLIKICHVYQKHQ